MANFNVAAPFLLSAEGGLSRSSKDTESRYPSPWVYKGQSGWHTNKGITYRTFIAMSSVFKYAVSAANFFSMPYAIWAAITKNGYWDAIGGDQLHSQAVAIAIVDYAFNFGVSGATRRLRDWLMKNYAIPPSRLSGTKSLVDVINTLTDKDETSFFQRLIQHRKAAYLALRQPANEAGWFKRMAELQNRGITLIKRHPIRGAAIATALVIVLAGAGLWWYSQKK